MPQPIAGRVDSYALVQESRDQPALPGNSRYRWSSSHRSGLTVVSWVVACTRAEWTSLGDRSFVGRVCLAAIAVTLAAAGGGRGIVAPVFAAALVVAVLAALLLDAFSP